MNKEAQLEQKIGLVRWEADAQRERFSLLTIHSLLIDSNPKFKQLRQIIENYNQEKNPDRIRLKQPFIERLFKMLSELTRISNSENQLEFLNKIYEWASNSKEGEVQESGNDKVRPVTATTKARSQSAYSRGTNRPVSGNFQKKAVINQELPPLNKKDPKIDYTRLRDGEKQFYCGLRSIHSQYEHPKKRLKEYQRKVFYEDGEDSDVEIIDLGPKLEVDEKKLMQQIEVADEEIIDLEGLEAENQEAGGEPLIDDIPIEGEEEPAEGQPQEPKQIIDKLKPKIKVYNDPKDIKDYNHKQYQEGIREIRKERNQFERRVQQDVEMAKLQAMWAQGKGRTKSELKRRAESARMIKHQIGIKYQREPKKEEKGTENIINFENVEPYHVNTKGSRPQTAFIATNPKKREELIKNAFIAGKLSNHIKKYEQGSTLSIPSQFNIVGTAFTAHSQAPKKKAFEDILRQAEERVIKQSQDEVLGVKEAFAKNKISIGANRIAKSITYYQKDLGEEERFGGVITGMTMLKNPFIKVAKKKKKKKKK